MSVDPQQAQHTVRQNAPMRRSRSTSQFVIPASDPG